MTSPSNKSNRGSSEEYFVSDLSATENNLSPPRVADNSVKVGLNVSNFKLMQGKPLTSLKSLDSSFTHVVTGVESSLSKDPNHDKANETSKPVTTSSEIRIDFSDHDITSSECGSSPNSLGDHFFLNSRMKFQTSTNNSLDFDNNVQSCVPFQSNKGIPLSHVDKYEECRSSCDEEFLGSTNCGIDIDNNKNPQSGRINTEPSLDRKSPELSDDASSFNMPPVKLARVISLGAFASPPIYDVDKAERQVTRLRRDKRRNTAKTNEFQELRLTFAMEAVKAVISKEKKSKLLNAVPVN
jgi:hypothetical protein